MFATYVLNLERHSERLEKIGRCLDKLQVNWTRFPGVDGNSVSEDVLDGLVARTGPIPRMPIGARACTVGHILMLRDFLNSKASHALILEDDAEVSPSLPKVLPKILAKAPHGILNINRQPSSRGVKRLVVRRADQISTDEYKLCILSGIHYGTAGYAIDRSSAEKIIELYPYPDVPIDHLLFNPNVSKLSRHIPIRQLFPALVQPRSGQESTIQNMKVDGSGKIWNRLKRAKSEISIAPRLLAGVLIGYYQLKTLEFKPE